MSTDVKDAPARTPGSDTAARNGDADNVPSSATAEPAKAPASGAPQPSTPDLGDRVNSLVRAILEQLVPESKRVAGSLAALEEQLTRSQDKVNELHTYAHRWTDTLLAEALGRATRAFDIVLSQVIYPLHDQLFTRVCAMEAGQEEPDPYLLNLLQNLEGYLDRIDIMVIRPQPGEAFDLKHMETLGAVPCRFFRKPDTVARVHHCGFALRHALKEGQNVARKALVDVYRKL
jgi:hypothetical protein